MNTSELVQSRHLDRKALIYVRQSSPNQVITNKGEPAHAVRAA
jgi:hypothetical protein